MAAAGVEVKPEVKQLTDEELVDKAHSIVQEKGLFWGIQFLADLIAARLNAGEYHRVGNLAVVAAWHISRKENDAAAFVFLENIADVLFAHGEKKAACMLYDRCLVFLSCITIGDLKPLMTSLLAPKRDALRAKMQQCEQ